MKYFGEQSEKIIKTFVRLQFQVFPGQEIGTLSILIGPKQKSLDQ